MKVVNEETKAGENRDIQTGKAYGAANIDISEQNNLLGAHKPYEDKRFD